MREVGRVEEEWVKEMQAGGGGGGDVVGGVQGKGGEGKVRLAERMVQQLWRWQRCDESSISLVDGVDVECEEEASSDGSWCGREAQNAPRRSAVACTLFFLVSSIMPALTCSFVDSSGPLVQRT